jgi:hypothetical protein
VGALWFECLDGWLLDLRYPLLDVCTAFKEREGVHSRWLGQWVEEQASLASRRSPRCPWLTILAAPEYALVSRVLKKCSFGAQSFLLNGSETY